MISIFLVEDESVIREGLRDNIPWEQYGYKFVGEAADGEMALPLIRKTHPDVLITDIKMPFMDGLSLSKVVNAEFPKTKIIIISGYDDFEYAREAIAVGAEQYLLKPITKLKLKNTLLELKEKIEKDREQSDYQVQFQNEMHEYEQFSRRRFFEKVLEGELSVKEIYEEAAKQSIELNASSYNLLFFYMQEKAEVLSDEELQKLLWRQEEALHFFLCHSQYVLFRWNVNSYAILIKSDRDDIKELTDKAIEHITTFGKAEERRLSWYIAVGTPVERLSQLPECYQKTSHFFAYRFMLPELRVLSEETLADYLVGQEDKNIKGVESAKMDPEIIKDFLSRGDGNEIHDFVESYLNSIREPLESRMFRDYVLLNIRFSVAGFLEALGTEREDYIDQMEESFQNASSQFQEIFDYFVRMLRIAISIRDRESDYQSGKTLRQATKYIDENYFLDSISLNSVAEEVKVSPNYLSAIFSQQMQKTFIEYVTGKRMEKARKLLKSTDKSSNEISLEVGYKDPHYFSFVFKKTQGCSPRDYRNSKK